jgi:hypothetical protein
MTITDFDKLQCVVRELGFRRRVYARRVEQGKMTQAQADREIAVMESIAKVYQRSTQASEPQLFPNDAA